MNKTMRQIAADRGVSKMTVYRIVTREHIKGRYGNDRALHFDDTAEQAIIAALGRDKTKNNRNRDHNSDISSDTVPDTSKTNLVLALNNRIESQQQQIEHLTRLLDQSQQLQLIAENKLKQLETPPNAPKSGSEPADDQKHERAPEAPVSTESSPEQSPSFWQRLFGSGK